MTGKKLQRLLACLLAVLLLSQVGAFSPAVLAADGSSYTLHDGTAVIPAGTSADDVNRILAAALVEGFGQMSAEEQDAIVNRGFEYYCEGKDGVLTHDAWGLIKGFTSTGKVLFKEHTYTHPALAANKDGDYKVRLAGTTQEVTLTKAQKPVSSITLKEGVTVTLPYNADVTINFDTLRERIFDQVVESTTPELTVNDVTIEYYATATKGAVGELGHDWVSLEGGKVSIYDYPAISEGNQQIRISYAGNNTYGAASAEVTITFADRADSHIVLKSGQKVALPYNDDVTVNYDALRADILQQVVDEGTTPALTTENTEIKYYATATTGAAVGFGKNWAPLEGGKVDGLNYPAISAGDQKIQISFKGDNAYKASSDEVTVTFTERPSVTATQKENPTFQLQYTDKNGTVEPDYENIQQQVWDAVIESTDPSLTASDVTIEYYATPNITIGGVGKNWAPLEGITTEIAGQKVGYPAIPEGTQKVRISWAGNKNYAPWTVEADVNITGRPEVEVATNENPTFKLDFTADGEAIYDNIRQQVWDAVVVSTNPALTVDDVTIEYYATAKTGAVKSWMPLEGGEAHMLTYPAIGEGTQKVRITWGGSKDYAAWTWEGDVEVTGRADAPFQLKEGVTEGMTVAMVYNRDQSINYEATAQALRDALLESTDPNISIDDVTVQYNADITGITKNYKPLDCNETLVLVKFGLGNQIIHFAWNGNADYKPLKLDDVKVNMDDHRIASAVVLKSGASITYNMDAKVMLQAIFENLIDWDASTLPEKSTLTLDDFTIEYYATAEVVAGDLSGDMDSFKDWVSIEGKGVTLGKLQLLYPQMGAGEQQIRVTFKGDEAYRPSTPVEGNLTVNKAKVSVKVHTTSIYADEAKDKLGEGFVTTDPADKFDIYTIYGGMTSDVTGSVFVQLPERYTNTALIKAIDWALEQAGQPTLTEMMNNGTTVGQLRKILSDVISRGADLPQFIKDALKNANIDIDTLVKLNEALNKLPGLLDNVRVAFGVPDQAGLYVVTAVTNNKNYETGVGTGMLLVKKHYSGVKLQWNQTIPNGKLTAEEATNFDFKATLSYNGNSDISQDNVHYLYSGFTSKWRPYSSTTTPPTEPGRYVVTVVTLGGNYQAAPITRAFQITK